MLHMFPQRGALDGLGSDIFKLMSFGATPEQWAEWLRAPLEHAAACGSLNLVLKLLAAGANGGAGWRGCRGRSLLDAAALGGNPDVVCALLQAGAQPDVNVVSPSSRRSALYVAAECGHEEAATRLIVAGADVTFHDLVDRCDVLHKAVRGDHEDLMRDLLIAGAEPNTRDEDGCTPLHVACWRGREHMVSALLARGADRDALDSRGCSPLLYATEQGHLTIAETLLAVGADFSLRGIVGHSSALDVAAFNGHVGILRAILRRRANPDACDEDGRTSLHVAASNDQAAAVYILVDAGAAVDGVTNDGWTPILLAASRNCREAALALLRLGASVNAPHAVMIGHTPLHLVCDNRMPGAEAMADLLLRWGADETAVNADGLTAADMLEISTYDEDDRDDFDGRDDHADDHEQHKRDGSTRAEIECLHALLARAPTDRAWRRRCWPVMCRARAGSEVVRSRHARDGNTEVDEGYWSDLEDARDSVKIMRRLDYDNEGDPTDARLDYPFGRAGEKRESGAEVARSLSSAIDMLIGVSEDGIFRSIVTFL